MLIPHLPCSKLIGSSEERLYRSLNSERLRAEKAQELREDFLVIYPFISPTVKLSEKIFSFTCILKSY